MEVQMQNVYEYITKSREDRRSHIDLDCECLEIGGKSTHFKGILAFSLGTTIPKGHAIHLCHACNNEKCCNPKHLYWGTPIDNARDRVEAGTQPNLSLLLGPERMKDRGKQLGSEFGGKNKLTEEQIN